MCPLCGGSDRELLSVREAWEIVRCASCRMVFLGHQLSYQAQQENHDWLGEYYNEIGLRKKKQPVMVFLSRLTRPFKAKTNDRLLSQTLKWASGGTLVDFGCGNGAFLERTLGKFDAVGVEMSPRSA